MELVLKPTSPGAQPLVASGEHLHGRRALTLLFEGHAQVVLNADDGSFQTYNFTEWHDFRSKNRIRKASAPFHSEFAFPASFCW